MSREAFADLDHHMDQLHAYVQTVDDPELHDIFGSLSKPVRYILRGHLRGAALPPQEAPSVPSRSLARRRRELLNRTKKELYEHAKSMGVEGRSSMSKTELVNAIVDHLRSA